MELTPRQSEIFEYIRDRIQNHQISPTVREIAKHFDIKSANGVICHLRALEKKGYIRHEKKIARGICLAEKPPVVEWAGNVEPGSYTIINSSGTAVGVIRIRTRKMGRG